jgi:hypothetical protein
MDSQETGGRDTAEAFWTVTPCEDHDMVYQVIHIPRLVGQTSAVSQCPPIGKPFDNFVENDGGEAQP